MATPFLLAFSHALVYALRLRGLIEVDEDRVVDVVRFLAVWLENEGKGKSLVSTTARGLVSCPDVTEVYVDDEGLKDVIDHLAVGG